MASRLTTTATVLSAVQNHSEPGPSRDNPFVLIHFTLIPSTS